MTLSATYEPRRQQGNGVTKEFSYSFDPYSLEALRVYIEENGVQTETQDYTATANENGGIVTFNVAPTSEQYVVIARSVPQDQEVPFYTSSGFDAGVVENSLDKLTAMVQEVNNEAVRSAKLPKGYNINLELPVPESGKGLYWNNEGTGFQNSRLNLDDVETLTKSYRDQSLAARDEAVASSTRAVNTVKEATDLLNNTQTYVEEAVETINTAVDDAKTTITETSEEAKETINGYVSNAEENVRQIAQEEANKAIEGAAAAATGIVVDYANNEIKPVLNEIASNAAESAENASESAGLAANESASAAISATDSQHYAEDSRIWAEGSDSEVKNVDGEHSSKVWSQMAKTSATSAASSAELAKQYGNDKINQTHITNCITEIPQDIKLELNDGTLTLKAGSKIYVPNGFEADGVTPKFDVVVIENDISRSSFGAASQKGFLMYYNGSLTISNAEHSTSGTNEPTGSSWLFYNTTTNLLYDQTKTNKSFPIAVFNVSSGVAASIDQVFNGFGYIGSTVFALPGVKGLIPNGRNEDGSLRNIEIVNSKVKTVQVANGNRTLVLTPSVVAGYVDTIYHIETNTNTNTAGAYQDCCHCGKVVVENGVIPSFTPKLPFRAVDYQDVEDIVNNLTKHVVVSTLPSSPDADTFYYIPE